MSEQHQWPEFLPVAQVRIARATRDIVAIRRFYCEGLGLQEIGSFEDHDGYDGVMIGLPGHSFHLEFTQHEQDGRQTPDPDDLLVLYVPEREAIGRLVVKLGAMGYFPVPPKNPYWEGRSVTFEDPDQWRVVLMESEGLG